MRGIAQRLLLVLGVLHRLGGVLGILAVAIPADFNLRFLRGHRRSKDGCIGEELMTRGTVGRGRGLRLEKLIQMFTTFFSLV